MKTPILMAIQPTETIFSFLVRWNKLCGYSTESHMSQLVFSQDRIRIHPYLPVQLNTLESILGVPTIALLDNHTLFPLFSFFNSKKLKHKMLFSSHTVTSLAGVPHAKLPITFGHKWCQICTAQSIKNKGFPILKIEHQIPGIISCAEHHCLLDVILAGEKGVDRRLVLDVALTVVNRSNPIADAFSRYAQQVLSLTRSSKVFDLKQLYRYHLQQKGYITRNGFIRISKLKHDFTSIIDKNNQITEPKVLNVLMTQDFLGSLLRQKTSFPAHPLKHLLFSFWLFNGNAELYLRKLTPIRETQTNVKGLDIANESIIQLLKKGLSMNAIEAQTGKSRCAIRNIAELNNIEHLSNAMQYPPEIKRAVQMKALMGTHRATIAEELSVGIGYVEQVICNTPHLTHWRKKLRHQVKIKEAEHLLRRIVKDNPSWTRTKVRMAAQAEYALLYFHDKRILNDCLPIGIKPVPPNSKP